MERDRDLAGTGAAGLSVTAGDLLDDVLRDYRLNTRLAAGADAQFRVDLQAGIVRLPQTATKNRDGRIIPRTAEVVGSLEMQKTRRELFHPAAERVFCFDDGQPITGLSSAWRIACRRAGFVDAANKPTKLLHDCRRSAVRKMVRSGTSEKVCMAISGHKTRSTFDRYDIVSEKDVMAAAKRLSDHVNGSADVPKESTEKPIGKRQSH